MPETYESRSSADLRSGRTNFSCLDADPAGLRWDLVLLRLAAAISGNNCGRSVHGTVPRCDPNQARMAFTALRLN